MKKTLLLSALIWICVLAGCATTGTEGERLAANKVSRAIRVVFGGSLDSGFAFVMTSYLALRSVTSTDTLRLLNSSCEPAFRLAAAVRRPTKLASPLALRLVR